MFGDVLRVYLVPNFAAPFAVASDEGVARGCEVCSRRRFSDRRAMVVEPALIQELSLIFLDRGHSSGDISWRGLRRQRLRLVMLEELHRPLMFFGCFS